MSTTPDPGVDDADDVTAKRQNAVGADAPERSDGEVPDPEPGGVGGEESTPVADVVDRTTNRLKGISVAALAVGAAGMLTSQPALLLSSVVGIAYVGYARAATVPEVALSVERSFDETSPDPGDEVTVAVSVRNEGERVLWDLRLVDGVPDALAVVDGSPRMGTALRPGQGVSFEYTVRAKRGDHGFDSLLAVVRDAAGVNEREVTFDTDDNLVSTPSTDPIPEVPLRALTSPYTGRVETADGGEGVEFFATREYRPGDTLSRIDWNRHARTGELATIEFREERAATVVLVMDLRSQAYVREDDQGLHAADRGVDAASRVFSSLLDAGDRVGLFALSPLDVWLAPGAGNDHRARARDVFATHPALSPVTPAGNVPVVLQVRNLRKRLSPEAQVILFSPLVDDSIVRIVRLLDAHGHLVTVISPDPTTDDTPGQQLASAERAVRMARLRGTGVRVVDWGPEDHLATAIDSATRRWSA